MTTPHGSYTTQTFNLSGLKGISDKTLEMHFKLYDGYVKQTNLLNEQIAEILEDGKIDQEEMPAYSELNRRLGFEYNGMVLHEYYFGNLKLAADPEPGKSSNFRQVCADSFGELQTWKTDFVGVGKMRGVGWAICYQDPRNAPRVESLDHVARDGQRRGIPPAPGDGRVGARLSAGLPARRPAKYIEAFFANVDWAAVDQRMVSGR